MASIRTILASAVSLQYVSGQVALETNEMSLSEAPINGGTLALTYKDCGDSDSHVKITDLSPKTLTIGRKAKLTGTGVVDEDVEGGTFEARLGLSQGLVLLDCSGDASQKKKCNFPLGTGSLTFEGVSFPMKAGPQDISMTLLLSRLLPASLVKTTTQVEAVSSTGQKIFCMKVFTGQASDENGQIPLSYEDCGDASTHAKITALTPKFAMPGQKTKITGSGMLDLDIAGASFQTKTTFTGGDLLSCSGDIAETKKCGMGPFGSLTFDGLQLPVKKGSSSISMDLSLSPLIPASLASTETTVTASTKSGEKLFCLKVFSAKANEIISPNCEAAGVTVCAPPSRCDGGRERFYAGLCCGHLYHHADGGKLVCGASAEQVGSQRTSGVNTTLVV